MVYQKKKSEMAARSMLKRVQISAHKVRKVIDRLRGCSYEQALILLEFMPYKACYPIWPLLYSAAANASHNLGLDKRNLYISKITVDQGPSMKRFRPRAQGRGYPIRKPTSSITVIMRSR